MNIESWTSHYDVMCRHSGRGHGTVGWNFILTQRKGHKILMETDYVFYREDDARRIGFDTARLCYQMATQERVMPEHWDNTKQTNIQFAEGEGHD